MYYIYRINTINIVVFICGCYLTTNYLCGSMYGNSQSIIFNQPIFKMKQKVFFIQSVIFLFFLFSCNKEEVLESKPEVSVIKGRISDWISVNDSIGIKNYSQESAKLKSSNPEIGWYTFAFNGKENPGVIKDGTARLSGFPFNPTPPKPQFLPESSYLPFIKLGRNGAWFSNTGRITRNNIAMIKTDIYVGPFSLETPTMLIYCSFVYNGYFYQFRNYPIVSSPGTSNLVGMFTKYTVQAFKMANFPYGETPVYKQTPAHYDGSGNYIAGGEECVKNCGGSGSADWQVGTVNITSVGYINGQDKFSIAGTLTVQGTTVPFDLARYYRVD